MTNLLYRFAYSRGSLAPHSCTGGGANVAAAAAAAAVAFLFVVVSAVVDNPDDDDNDDTLLVKNPRLNPNDDFLFAFGFGFEDEQLLFGDDGMI